jgi:hypothetical protein
MHHSLHMSLFSKLSLLILLSSAACFAQLPFSIGVKAGVPITDSFTGNSTEFGVSTVTSSRTYIIGPMIELKLPFNLSVEADGLYRPYNAMGSIGASNHFNNTYSVWEFPVLAQYRFAFPIAKPYIEAGPSFRTSTSAISFISNSGFTAGAA